MKILFLTNGYPPDHTAGTENYTAGIATALARRGHLVQVLCAGAWDTGPQPLNGTTVSEYAGVNVTRLNLNWAAGPDPNRWLYDHPLVEQFVGQALDAFRPDLVHFTSGYTLSASGLRAVKARGVPLVVTLTDFWFICPQITLLRWDGQICSGQTTPWECLRCLLAGSGAYQRANQLLPEFVLKPVFTELSRHPRLSRQRGLRGFAPDMAHRKRTLRELLALADATLVPSRFVGQVFAQNDLPSPRVIEWGQEPGWLKDLRPAPPRPPLVFGYVGRITPTKGVHTLLEAAALLGDVGGFEVHVFGDLEQEPAYSAQLKALAAAAPAVKLRGGFARAQLAEVYSQLHVLVVPSLWYETFSLVVQEAFGAGVPVIASKLGRLAEFVDHDLTGLLFEAGSAPALAAAMRRLLAEPALLERLRAGILPVRTLAQEVTLLEGVYDEVRAPADHA